MLPNDLLPAQWFSYSRYTVVNAKTEAMYLAVACAGYARCHIWGGFAYNCKCIPYSVILTDRSRPSLCCYWPCYSALHNVSGASHLQHKLPLSPYPPLRPTCLLHVTHDDLPTFACNPLCKTCGSQIPWQQMEGLRCLVCTNATGTLPARL